MISKKFAEFATTISFNVKEDSTYGFMNGFLFSLYETASKKSFYIYYINDQSILAKDGSPISIMTISGILQDIFSKYGITDYSVKENGIEITCALSYKKFYNLMSETSKKLSEIPSIQKTVCSDCLKQIDASEKKFRISVDEKNKILCEECAKKNADDNDEYSEDDTIDNDVAEDDALTENYEAASEENNVTTENEASTDNNSVDNEGLTKNYDTEENEPLTENDVTEDEEATEISDAINSSKSKKCNPISKGILGSLLFTLGASICFVLIYAFVLPLPEADSTVKAGYYVSWLSGLIAVCSVFGYKVFSKNRIDTKELLISGGISLVLTFIAQYFSSIIFFSRANVFTFENLTSERFSKMIPSLLKIPFTDNFVGPDFKIYILMDSIFIITALLLISFFTRPPTTKLVVIQELE